MAVMSIVGYICILLTPDESKQPHTHLLAIGVPFVKGLYEPSALCQDALAAHGFLEPPGDAWLSFLGGTSNQCALQGPGLQSRQYTKALALGLTASGRTQRPAQSPYFATSCCSARTKWEEGQ